MEKTVTARHLDSRAFNQMSIYQFLQNLGFKIPQKMWKGEPSKKILRLWKQKGFCSEWAGYYAEKVNEVKTRIAYSIGKLIYANKSTVLELENSHLQIFFEQNKGFLLFHTVSNLVVM